MEPVGRIETAHLFLPLHRELIALLKDLAPEDWEKPTACRGWGVRDIAAHLLDGDIRKISVLRDGVTIAPGRPVDAWDDLVAFLNELNAAWVRAARRMSSRLLVQFLEVAGPQAAEVIASLDPDAPSIFPVAWAGDEVSPNWFDMAREYTERWHHQQQIRDAVSAPPLYGKRWMHPVLDAFVRALPRRYRAVEAAEGACLAVIIEGEAGGEWALTREEGAWRLYAGRPPKANATVAVTAEAAWRLFTKDPRAVRRVRIEGDRGLAEPFLTAVAVMA
jgi:uncharacterized protein (TIGR03083 family)